MKQILECSFVLSAALAVALSAPAPALAEELINVHAGAAPFAFRGSVLAGDCEYRNLSLTETVEVTYWVTLTLSDGTVLEVVSPEVTTLEPGWAMILSPLAIVPEDAAAGEAQWSCQADAVVLAGGQPSGPTVHDEDSVPTRIVCARIRPKG